METTWLDYFGCLCRDFFFSAWGNEKRAVKHIPGNLFLPQLLWCLCLLLDWQNGVYHDTALRVSTVDLLLWFFKLWATVASNIGLQRFVASSERVPYQVCWLLKKGPSIENIIACSLKPQMQHIHLLWLRQKHLCAQMWCYPRSLVVELLGWTLVSCLCYPICSLWLTFFWLLSLKILPVYYVWWIYYRCTFRPFIQSLTVLYFKSMHAKYLLYLDKPICVSSFVFTWH